MPVDFLTTQQELNYGRYVAEPNDVQLARYFHLDERDLAFINQRRGRHNRLGIALRRTSARFLGTFLTDLTRVLPGVQQFVAVQLNIRRPEVLSRYAVRDTTLREHNALIKEHYGYHGFGDFPWSFRLKRLLYTRAWLSNERPGLMFDFATAWLLQNKVLLPGATTLVRLVSEIRERANQRLWKKLATLPDSWQTARVTELLDIPEGQRISSLEQLKKGPVNPVPMLDKDGCAPEYNPRKDFNKLEEKMKNESPEVQHKVILGMALTSYLLEFEIDAKLGGSLVARLYGAARAPKDVDIDIGNIDGTPIDTSRFRKRI